MEKETKEQVNEMVSNYIRFYEAKNKSKDEIIT